MSASTSATHIDAGQIPVTVLTGYLGAGKTTLLEKLLRWYSERPGLPIAVIVNDVNQVSVDDVFLGESGQPIFKLAGGCLCCSAQGDLNATLNDLLKRRGEFGAIVIETTGLANPASLVERFLANPEFAQAFYIDGVVTLVDPRFYDLHSHTQEWRSQVMLGNTIFVNHCDSDLVDPARLAQISGVIRRLNPLAKVRQTHHGEVDPAEVLGLHAFSSLKLPAEWRVDDDCGHDHPGGVCNHPGHHHQHDERGALHCETPGGEHRLDPRFHDEDVLSVGFEFPGRLNDRERFGEWYSAFVLANGGILPRTKGELFFDGDARGRRYQSVHRVFTSEIGAAWKPDAMNRMVFIGAGLDRATLWAKLQEFLVPEHTEG